MTHTVVRNPGNKMLLVIDYVDLRHQLTDILFSSCYSSSSAFHVTCDSAWNERRRIWPPATWDRWRIRTFLWTSWKRSQTTGRTLRRDL